MEFRLRSWPRALPLLLTAALSFAPGCFGAVGPAYVDVAYVPPNYATYPSYVYDGATVYFIDGRWYRHDRGHWVYYRSEPVELYRYRTHRHIVIAPPVYRAPPPRGVYRAPPRREVYRAPPRRDVYRAPPRRDDRRYRAPARDEHRHREHD